MTCRPDVLMVDGDLPAFTRIRNGLEVIAQRIDCRLRTVKGDWRLDTSAGIDWLGFLGVKPVNLPGLASAVVLEILAVPGVITVTDLDWSQSGTTATITAQIITECGDLALTVDPNAAVSNMSSAISLIVTSRRIVP